MLEEALPAEGERKNCVRFKAFGEDCEFCSQGIKLSGQIPSGPEGVLIALCSLHTKNKQSQMPLTVSIVCSVEKDSSFRQILSINISF